MLKSIFFRMIIFIPAFIVITACADKGEGGASDTSDQGDGSEPLAPADPCFDDPLDFQVGTGEDAFELLTEGDRLEVIHGTQDGHHILGSARIQNITPIATIRFQIVPLADGVAVSDQVYRVQLLPDTEHGECAGQVVGMYAYLGRIDPGNAPFLGELNEIRMTVTNEMGEARTKAIKVTPYLPAIEH